MLLAGLPYQELTSKPVVTTRLKFVNPNAIEMMACTTYSNILLSKVLTLGTDLEP